MVELTKSQKEVLDKIKLFIEKNGYAPTVRELCFLTDRNSPATIHFHLKHLKEKGYIDFDYNKNRTVKLINDNKDKVINDLLKRISNIEYEEERLNNIIKKVEECIDYYAIENEDFSKFYNNEEIEILKIIGSDKEWIS